MNQKDDYDWSTDDRIPPEALSEIDEHIAGQRWAWFLIGLLAGVALERWVL